MRIKYVHASAPNEVRMHDTEKSLRGSTGMQHALNGRSYTQKEWDTFIFESFAKDMKKGLILSYGIAN